MWITRHWQHARSIDLDLSHMLEEPYEVLVSSCKGTGKMQQSQTVKRFDGVIRAGPEYCSDYEEDEDMLADPWTGMEERAEKGKDLEEVVCWLLGYLPALEVLKLEMGHYPATLPALGNLRELSLCVRHWKVGLQDSLIQLSSLERLKLAAERHSERTTIPECFLKPLTSLQELELEYLLPIKLQLPAQCRLTLIQHAQLLKEINFGAEGWDEACLDVLDTCAIEWNESGPQSRTYRADEEIPFLEHASAATAMALCGMGQYSFEPILLSVPGLANVTDLFLQSKELVATIPGSLPLTCLQVIAHELHLDFEDPEATASRLEHLLVIPFKEGQPADDGPRQIHGRTPLANPLEALEAPLAARGKTLKRADRLMYRNKWTGLATSKISLADQDLIIWCIEDCLMDTDPEEWEASQQAASDEDSDADEDEAEAEDSDVDGEADADEAEDSDADGDSDGNQAEDSDVDEDADAEKAEDPEGTVWLHEFYEKQSNVIRRFAQDFRGRYIDVSD